MHNTEFELHLQYMQHVTADTLLEKAREYAADGDRLHNFRVAAEVQGISPVAALGGMMAKHTVSVYDMIRDCGDRPRCKFSTALWEEKIKDSINYLYLLWALINEDAPTTAGDALPGRREMTWRDALESVVEGLSNG